MTPSSLQVIKQCVLSTDEHQRKKEAHQWYSLMETDVLSGGTREG